MSDEVEKSRAALHELIGADYIIRSYFYYDNQRNISGAQLVAAIESLIDAKIKAIVGVRTSATIDPEIIAKLGSP